MNARHNLLNGRSSFQFLPKNRRMRIGRLTCRIKFHPIKCLKNLDEHERRFVIRELLTEADSWASVEWDEDEGFWDEVFLDTSVEEAIGVEHLG